MTDLRREGSELAAAVVDGLMAEIDGAGGAGSPPTTRPLDRFADLLERTFAAYTDAVERVVRSPNGGDPNVSLAGAPGDEAVAEVWIHNTTEERIVTGALTVTDLQAPAGARIDASRATFAPAALAVPANASASASLTVSIPLQAPPGAYDGLVLAGELPAASVPVRLVVR